MTYCHVSAQIADHAEEMAQDDAREIFITECLNRLADYGSIGIGDTVIEIGDVIEQIGDDPSYKQAYMEILQGNTMFLEHIMDTIATELIEAALE